MAGHQQLGHAQTAVSLLLVMTVGYAVYAMDRTVLSSVLSVMQTSLRLTNEEVFYLGSAQYIGVLSVVFLAGRLSDLYGRRRILVLGVATFTLFTWLVGLAPSYAFAFLFRLISGVGEGLFWPVAMASVTELSGAKKGLSLGVFYVGFDVGSVAGVSLGTLAFALSDSWRYAFLVAPLLGLPVLGGLLFMKSPVSQPLKSSTTAGSASARLRRKGVLALLAFAFLATWASVWQVVFLPYYFNRAEHFGIVYAGLLGSAVLASGGVGKLVVGAASDRLGRDRLLIASSAGVVLSYAVFFLATNIWMSIAGALAMGFLSSSVFPVMQATATDIDPSQPGTVLGLTTTAQSVATVLAPIIAAQLTYLGVGKAIALSAMVPSLLMTFVAVLLFLLARTGMRTAEGQPVKI